MAKQIKIYISPSNHGANQNRCLHKNCYEDKHTRPIAERLGKYLEYNGILVKIGRKDQSIYSRMQEADAWGADIYFPVHTNACGTPSARYVLFMSWLTTGKYATLYNNILPYIDDVYDGKIYHRQAQNLIEVNTPKALTLYAEYGFHTNQIDCDKYIHEVDVFAKATAKGFCKQFGITFKDFTKPAPAPAPSKKGVLVVDGIWGQSTTKYLQKLLNTPQDGIISNQLNSCKKYLLNAHTNSWKFGAIGYGGSTVIKAMQKVLGVKADGYAGKDTVVALQNFLKRKGYNPGAADGLMGEKTVKALQMYINDQFK